MSLTFFTKHTDIGYAVCGECRTTMSYSYIDGIGGYLHINPIYDTHFPKPIPELECLDVIYLCDFCCNIYDDKDLGTVWTKVIEEETVLGHTELSPDWAACITCLEFIETNDWMSLLYRASQNPNFANKLKSEVYEFLTPLFTEVLNNVERIDQPSNRKK